MEANEKGKVRQMRVGREIVASLILLWFAIPFLPPSRLFSS